MNPIWVLTWTVLLVDFLEVYVSAPVSLNSMQYILKKPLPHLREKTDLDLHSSLLSSAMSLTGWNLVPLSCTTRYSEILLLCLVSVFAGFVYFTPLPQACTHYTRSYGPYVQVHLPSYEPPLCLSWRLLWVFSLPFLPLLPWHLVHPVGGNWYLLFQSKWAICFLLSNLIRKREISVRRFEPAAQTSWAWKYIWLTCIWGSTLALLFFPSRGEILSVQRRHVQGGEVGLGHPLDSWRDMFIVSVNT